MVDVLTEMLARLRADNDLDMAAISADGLMVASDAASGFDAEGICATAGDGFLMMMALGVELQRGEPVMLTIEYETGTVVVCPLEHGAVLVMLTGNAVNLGRLRLAARRFQAQYLESAALAA
jgi:predicted regulator of Ras-like GTPase activity (Roadblock/LC7/MglB family)